ncbi:methyltransferase [Candidatus Liberibacter solanacearum]|uniref:COG4123: Predicted O-methyltransferase n=1 Tax=Candidatus Liberibacter solanacearum TaxID=556287 RepID=A0A094Z1A7_9HYPH|nr:methyltransferase [Candidatus Liberibacter solanacearum]KGB28000.1 methyltransferase [Candidatus Liberibacter solanacearum]KJZ80936.1 methyltransferase [Candidatus Liberibacter solanacearum]KJZ82092.1 COG4123: Predicted O-methyltransferase [Candidatus Liberibacter solanacearum]KQC49494.1 methyltransferase [Candidatus Liberibacter solanacearum]
MFNNITEKETIDAFHQGHFYLAQPLTGGHRAGMDAMILASLVDAKGLFHLADLGAGAGAAGLAIASRLHEAQILLVELSPLMANYARKTLALPANAQISKRVSLIEADVTLTGEKRSLAGLKNNFYDHVIMNPPFNERTGTLTPDKVKEEAHVMLEGSFEKWIRTACAIMRPSGQLSLIARPQSLIEVVNACARRIGSLEITPLYPRKGECAIRILVTGRKGMRGKLNFRSPIFLHEPNGQSYSHFVTDLINGKATIKRLQK